jgi:hypothetical protein
MGLGPLICAECRVYAERRTTNESGGYRWVCPVCGSEAELDYLWMSPEKDQEVIDKNSQFIRFVQGRDEANKG